jgi:ABC-type multidrug transport system ATPase subunit
MMGSSGSGKTTLLSCLVGITSLDSGEIELFGEPFGTTKKTRIGYMPQEISLITGFTVREMIYFFGIIAGMSDEKIREKFQFLSKLLELPDKDRLTRDCSGGQQRRISFAASLVHDPEILILDEPTVVSFNR